MKCSFLVFLLLVVYNVGFRVEVEFLGEFFRVVAKGLWSGVGFWGVFGAEKMIGKGKKCMRGL